MVKYMGDDVNTDVIHNPAFFTIDKSRLSSPVMDGRDGGAKIIIAGKNLGAGSSRYSTVVALKNSGLMAACSPLFSRIFEKNLAACGIFPVRLTADPVEIKAKWPEGAEMSLDFFIEKGLWTVTAKTTAKNKSSLIIGEIDPYLFEITAGGGMVKWLHGKLR